MTGSPMHGTFPALGVQLLAALLFLLPPCGDAGAEDSVTTRVNVYADDDATTVISPMLVLEKNIFEETSLNLQYLADIQSCASVDVVSTASPSMGYEEVRHNIAIGGQHRIDLTSFGLGYAYSIENDYISHAVSANFAQELFQRNFTVAGRAGYRWDWIGRVNDEFFSQRLQGLTATVSLTQLFSPRVLGQLSYFFEYLDGYQSSPYRTVPVGDFSVPETHPQQRFRHALTARVKEGLGEDWVAEQSFRFYLDSWGMTGQTLLLQVYWQPLEAWTFRLRYRFHNQTKADFYQEYYLTLREYMTRDREIGTLWSHLGGPQVVWRLEDLWIFPAAAFDVKVEYFYINYRDYALLQDKEGLLVGAGFNLLY